MYEPVTAESYTARYRTAAVALDLALTEAERDTISTRVRAGAPAVRMQPVCALIGLGLNYDDALPWTEPLYDQDDGTALRSAWEDALPDLPYADDATSPWRAVAVLGAAYLHGRLPEPAEVVALARRAVDIGLPRFDSPDDGTTAGGRSLRAAYDRFAPGTLPGGMGTAPPPDRSGWPVIAAGSPPATTPVALLIVSDALGRPVPEAGQYVQNLLALGGPGREKLLCTADPEQARWFDSQSAAAAYYGQQHGLRPWDAQPNRPLTAYTVRFVPRDTAVD